MKRNAMRVVILMLPLSLLPGELLAQNPNCTLVIPSVPLTAKGLATPYQLTATDSNNGPCNETNTNQSAFVQAAVIDPATGAISIYNPLVIDQGTSPAVSPVVPALPNNAVVALWFGFNGDTLTLQGADLASAGCVNGLPNSNFGQFAYCNAPAFFKAARQALHKGQIQVPPLGVASDGEACPTVRDFSIVDQDQSDNLPTSYLITSAGLLAQNTKANLGAFPGATVLGNPSDNGLLDKVVDVALGCTPWKAPDLADPGQMVASLPLNEMHAAANQAAPVALIPLGDPMVLNNGSADASKANAYRRGVDQHQATGPGTNSTARYCRHLYRIAPARMLLNQTLFTATPSPLPDVANSLFTFLAQRFVGTYDILGCADLLQKPDPISVVTDPDGIAVDASIKAGCQKQFSSQAAADNAADAPDSSE